MSNPALDAEPTNEELAEAEKFLAEMPNLSLDQLHKNVDEPVAMYLREIIKLKPLTPDEEQNLLLEKEEGSEKAQRILTEANLDKVILVASQYLDSGADLLDLIQEGNIGLIRAVQNYSEATGYKFQPFLISLIRRYVIDRIENPPKPVTFMSPTSLATAKRIHQNHHRLTQELGREPTIAELAKDMSLPIKTVNKFLAMNDSAIATNNIEELEKTRQARIARGEQAVQERFGRTNIPTRSLQELVQEVDLAGESRRNITEETLIKIRQKKTRNRADF